MPFFRNNQQLDVLNITGAFEPGTRQETGIRLQNNTELNLNLDGLVVNPSIKNLSNVDQIKNLKIVIDWGDGKSDQLSPIFEVKNSTINTKYKPWTSTSHRYSLATQESNLTLTIYVYNHLNDCLIVKVPITIQFQSLLDSHAKLNLVSANITNDNKVSYVINNSVEKSNFIVGTL